MTDTLNPPTLTREERTALRLKSYRRRRLIGWIALATVLVLAAAGGYLVWGTSMLGLKSVEVSSTAAALDPDLSTSVSEAVAVPIGTPLISVNLEAVRLRVEALPAVADAAVSRHWPGTLRVSVTPRVPIAAVAANASIYLMDAAGVPYQTVAAKPADLLNLRLATPGPGDPATMAGLGVVQALPPVLVPQIASVTARGPYDVSIELTDGRTVLWGGPDKSARKAQILPAMLTQPGTEFDISDPELVTVR